MAKQLSTVGSRVTSVFAAVNERADAAAKSALTSLITNMKVPASELIPASTSSVWMSGRIYGTAAGVINSMLFSPLLVLLRTANTPSDVTQYF